MLENDPKVEITYTIEVHPYSGSAEVRVTESWLDHIQTTTHRFTCEEGASRFVNSHPMLSSI